MSFMRKRSLIKRELADGVRWSDWAESERDKLSLCVWLFEGVGEVHFHVKGLQLLCRSKEIIHALF